MIVLCRSVILLDRSTGTISIESIILIDPTMIQKKNQREAPRTPTNHPEAWGRHLACCIERASWSTKMGNGSIGP